MNDVLDTETTGLSFRDRHKIVEIACMRLKICYYWKSFS